MKSAKPEIILIAAVAGKNRVIGKDNKLPWHISEDLKRFKRLTLGHPVLMGRKTFESIIARNGKPLPDRKNIVLTSSKSYPEFESVVTYNSIASAISACANQQQIAVIGGESIYRSAMPFADRFELTIVEGDYEGDAFFPEYRQLLDTQFELTAREQGAGYCFETYVKRSKP